MKGEASGTATRHRPSQYIKTTPKGNWNGNKQEWIRLGQLTQQLKKPNVCPDVSQPARLGPFGVQQLGAVLHAQDRVQLALHGRVIALKQFRCALKSVSQATSHVSGMDPGHVQKICQYIYIYIYISYSYTLLLKLDVAC